MVHHSQQATDFVKVDKVMHMTSNHSATDEFIHSTSNVNIWETAKRRNGTILESLLIINQLVMAQEKEH